MSATGISLREFMESESLQIEEDMEIMTEVGRRMLEAREADNGERIRFFVKSIQHIMRTLYEYEPSEPDEIDKQIQEAREFFKA